MAGRPKTMVKRMTALEETAFQLAVDIHAARPRQYAEREGKKGDDELALSWNRACRAVGTASIAVAIHLSLLEERAGLDSETLERQREERRGLWPCEEGEAKGTENAERASS
jgi:hypothetical protein